MWLIRKIFILPIVLYQVVLGPYLTPACRFQPSCSVYAKEAILKHGVIKGIYLTIRRLLRCHPFGKSGYDPVPQENPKPCFRRILIICTIPTNRNTRINPYLPIHFAEEQKKCGLKGFQPGSQWRFSQRSENILVPASKN